MVLADIDIKKALKSGRIKINPLPEFKTALGSCSIDLRLGNIAERTGGSQSPCKSAEHVRRW